MFSPHLLPSRSLAQGLVLNCWITSRQFSLTWGQTGEQFSRQITGKSCRFTLLKSNHSGSYLCWKGLARVTDTWALAEILYHSCLSQDFTAQLMKAWVLDRAQLVLVQVGALDAWSVALWSSKRLSLGHAKSRFRHPNQKQVKGGNRLFCAVNKSLLPWVKGSIIQPMCSYPHPLCT